MSKKILCGFLGLMLAGTVMATSVLAQPGGGPGRGGAYAGGGFQARFQDIKRQQLGPALGVNQPIVDRLLEIDRRYQPLRQQMIRAAKTDFQRLEAALNQPNPSNREIKSILDSVKGKEREITALKQRQDDEEMAILSPVQYARYIMYQKNLMREARSIKGGPGRGAPMAPHPPTELPVSRTR
jgi:hypothetical protein